MTQIVSIPRNRNLSQSEDYEFLRTEGLRYMEELSGMLWTDYNQHDPGITIKEILCYAITDLGYRTSFDMKDLLAKKDTQQQVASPLFSAKEILTCNPTTLLDWRKLLVDLDGIKNAWLFKTNCQEVDFYADCEESTLQYYLPTHKIKLEKVRQSLAGKDIDILQHFIDQSDNLENETISIDFSIRVNDPDIVGTIIIPLTIPLPGWETINENLNTTYLNFINADSLTGVLLDEIQFDNLSEQWQAKISVQYEIAGSPYIYHFQEVVIEGVDENLVRYALEDFLRDINHPENPIGRYQRKVAAQLARLTEHHLQLKGLMDVLLEYEEETQFGDLNSDFLRFKTALSDPDLGTAATLEIFDLEVLMPSWNHISKDLPTYLPFMEGAFESVNYQVGLYDDVNDLLHLHLQVAFPAASGHPPLQFENLIFKGVKTFSRRDVLIKNIDSFIQQFTQRFQAKLQRLRAINQEVYQTLHQHRNLCEDFKNISGIAVNEIGICGDILLKNTANLIETQAQILFAIQEYLSPSIRFYSLSEMLAKGMPSEAIFNGPALKHGFIIDEEIAKSSLLDKKYIYASDLINLIMDIEGVVAVKDLLLTKYDTKGKVAQSGERWCLATDVQHKASLSIAKSKILFFKDDLPYILSDDNHERMLARLTRLKTINERYKVSSVANDFPIPEGTPVEVDNYTPLRFSLPQNYGVGETGLPETATSERRAKAKQLQAYLAIFDQLLANYLSQLNNLDKVFSIEEATTQKLEKTYYNQFLGAENLGNKDLYVDANILEDAAGSIIGDNSLQRLTESRSDYLDRRNRFLDHLLARFSESFSEYALLVFNVLDPEEKQQLIKDKIQFLNQYPIISSQRGKGFNYKDPTQIWNTDNVVGLQKRGSKLLGMEDFLRQDFHCPSLRDQFSVIPKGNNLFSFELKDAGNSILVGVDNYASEEAAMCAIEECIKVAVETDNYTTKEISAGQFIFQIGFIDPLAPANNTIYANSTTPYPSKKVALEAAFLLQEQLKADFEGTPCTVEGMHIIEHILLRPKQEYKDQLFEVCLDKDCFLCGEEDPYSFRVSVVLPYWMERFVDTKLQIRTYVERMLRLEAPAHVHLKICWVSNLQMRRLDVHYRRWLEEQAKEFPDSSILSERLNCLIQTLGELRNVYPEAYLHDCDDGEQESTIVLGKTYLGSFKAPPTEELEA